GADGITLTGADGITLTGADGAAYTGPNGITLTGADGITLTGADGITLTGADGITLTGADGTVYRADSVVLRRPNGITLTGADGITLTGADGITLTGADGTPQSGADGITLTGADGITLTGADGITLTGADGITLTGADSVTGFNTAGIAFDQVNPSGITLTGADGITLTGADGITLTGADGIVFRNIDGITLTGADEQTGLQSVDPELAIALNKASDDSNINAVVVFHNQITEADLGDLRTIGIQGGTRFRMLPMVYVSGTPAQIIAISRLPSVRSIYGNRTLTLNSDPYYNRTGIARVAADGELTTRNAGMPVSGKDVTVAVLDTGINAQHADLAGRVVQNVRLVDSQSVPAAFSYPAPVENLRNTDPSAGHGTFVAGVVAASGVSSDGKYAGVAPGAKLLGLSAGDLNLTHVLAGFDYVLEKGAAYNVKVVNCSFSANTVFDHHDPVNIATKMLTAGGVNIVFSTGNSGPGTLNPYAAAPWVIGVGATDQNGVLAGFSSRGTFQGENQQPTLVAPGVNVASVRNAPTTTSVGGLAGADAQRLTREELPFYTTASGTSFSAPQVAGAVALMLDANPNLRPAEIKDILGRTATPLTKYFYHEAGAGMLNTYAAVLEAAFPNRRMGVFRSTLSQNTVKFVTATSQSYTDMVFPGLARSTNISIPVNTVQASVGIFWGLSANDFGLKLYNSADTLVAESNYLNLPGLTGRREKILLRNPASQTFRAAVEHTLEAGTSQNVYGSVELTRVEFPELRDLTDLSAENLAEAERSLLANIMLTEGRRFRPDSPMSRFDLAAAFVRAGLVPQYLAAGPMFVDARDLWTRNAVESVQSNPGGQLFYDAAEGGRFNPSHSASRLAAAVAFVRAANFENMAATSTLPGTVTDAASIPSAMRGYAAVALQKGFLRLEGGRFDPNRAVTRLETARAINVILQ
ncbi:MAG TPA: S8 family serine peptidase, partial [Pyrinomonadaceae bacterium]|nr:S8 family serine peptidase [Pyrinomonadaceae bacterium]